MTLLKQLNPLKANGLLMKRATETVQNKIRKQKIGSLNMLLGTLVANLLGNLLSGKRVNKKGIRIKFTNIVSK